MSGMKSARKAGMSTTAAEASLINGSQFLEELEMFEPSPQAAPQRATNPGPVPPMHADEFNGLESGLPMHTGAHHDQVPHHERAPIPIPDAARSEDNAPPERRISFLAAVLIIIVCLSAGAATAAFLFHDRLAQFTAPRASSR